jgi:hypothetical protein
VVDKKGKIMKQRPFNLLIVCVCAMLLWGVLAGPAGAQDESTLAFSPVKDNYINRCSNSGTATNYGGAGKLLVRSFDGIGCTWEEPKSVRTIMQFDIPNLKCEVSQAVLRLYYFQKLGSLDPAGRTYEIRRLLNDWTEGSGAKPILQGGTSLGSSWENRHNFGEGLAFPWDSFGLAHILDRWPDTDDSAWPYLGGGDFPYTDYNEVDHWGGDEVWATAVVLADFGWMEWDVTELVQAWLAGTFPNHGIVIRDAQEQWHSPGLYPEDNKFGTWFYSRECVVDAEEDYRPCLVVTYDLSRPFDPNTSVDE